MTSEVYEFKIWADGEARDADGRLLDADGNPEPEPEDQDDQDQPQEAS